MDGASPQCSTGWHELAVVRARDLRLRAGFSVLIAFGGLLVARGPWPLLWLAATLMAQLASVAVTEPMRRNPRFPVSRRRGFAFAVSLGTSAAVFAASGPFFWFDGGDDGRLLAILVLAGGAVNVALQAGSSARLLWIGCAPFMILLQLLPLISLAAAAGPQRRSLTLIAFGAGLIVAHLAAGGLSNVQSARRMKQAVREARLERQRAEAASAAKSDFLAVMSHELRTPLNGVLGMAQAMGADELAPAQRERVEILRRSGEILLLLLNDLLDISRIETDRLQIERGVVDIGALAAQAEAVFAPLAAAKRLDFHVRLQASAGAARLGDPDRVRQVLHKLIGNAIKFTDEGEVTALISGFGDELIFEVIDTGPGIAPDQLPNVFERFSQSDPSAARRHGGSGVGLAIARGLARLMEGDVTVRSAPGEGAVFSARLRLPLTQAAPIAPEPQPQPQLAARRLRILAAEDHPTNQLVLRTLLGHLGIEAHIVEDGEAAVAAARSAAWDLVLMDIQMPGMDGLAAARAIRAAEAAEGRPRTPILAVTANSTARQAAEYMEAGMDGLAPKPIQLSQLASVIQDVLAADAEEGAAARPAA